MVWAWDFLFYGFLAVVSRPLLSTVFRSAICDCLSLNGCFSLKRLSVSLDLDE